MIMTGVQLDDGTLVAWPTRVTAVSTVGPIASDNRWYGLGSKVGEICRGDVLRLLDTEDVEELEASIRASEGEPTCLLPFEVGEDPHPEVPYGHAEPKLDNPSCYLEL